MTTTTTTAMSPADAIATSRSPDQIVHVTVAGIAAAEAYLADLQAAAADGEDTDHTDTGDTIEVWGYDADTSDDSMTWRVHVHYA